VSSEICTSGEPVSASLRLCESMISAFRAAEIKGFALLRTGRGRAALARHRPHDGEVVVFQSFFESAGV
jgi:hypothetical protein